MSTKRKIIIFSAGLVFILGAFWLIIFKPTSPEVSSTSEAQLGQILETLAEPARQISEMAESPRNYVQVQKDLQPLSELELEQRALELQVKDFIERWASFSNQNDFDSPREQAEHMTGRMQDFSDSYIADLSAEHPYTAGYYGVTTAVVSVDFSPPFDKGGQGGVITASVGTRRTESVLDKTQEFNQSAEISLIKFGDEWLVDSIFWASADDADL